MNITLYTWGSDGVYSDAIEADPAGPMPARSTPTAPPEVPEGRVARWVGAWVASEPAQPAPALPVVPASVSRAQGKAALIGAELWPAVLAYFADISDPKQRALAEVALHDTLEWRRDSPFLAVCAVTLGLSESDLDNLFITAAGITL